MNYSVYEFSQNLIDNKEIPYEKYFYKDELENKKEVCQGIINSKNNKLEKVYGRKCLVKIISKEISKQFIDKYHIQGSTHLSIISFGLFYKDDLIGVMSLGRHHRQSSGNIIVLDRLCFKNSLSVLGGSGKLFKQAKIWSMEKKYDAIISFSENRLSDGKVYEVLGFNLEREYKSDYFYVHKNDLNKRISKQSQKKSQTNCPGGFTEYEWSKERGLLRFWDKGKKRWSFKLNKDYKTWNEKTSENCAKQHEDGLFNHSHIRGMYKSSKIKDDIYFGSSFELRCLYLMDKDKNIKSFKRGNTIRGRSGSFRSPDFFVTYKNEELKLVEVEPKKMYDESSNQIKDYIYYCKEKNIELKIWNEDDSEFNNSNEITNWAKEFVKNKNIITKEFKSRKEINNAKSKKHYHSKIKNHKVIVNCEFCKEKHEVLELSYNRNLEKNGRFICIKENGSIVGKKSKNKKDNPYAIDGKKQCAKCQEIKLFECFGSDKSRRDGYSSRCKECRKK